MRTLIFDNRKEVSTKIATALDGLSSVEVRSPGQSLDIDNIDTVIYKPPLIASQIVDVAAASEDFQRCADKPVSLFVLLSSACVFRAGPSHRGLVPEDQPFFRTSNRIANSWQDVETRASAIFEGRNVRLAILRSATVLDRGGKDSVNRLLSGRVAFTLPGHDPSLQLLSPDDLAEAIRCVVVNRGEGIYHVAPSQPIPIKKALRASGIRRIPIPRLIQSGIRRISESVGGQGRHDELDYIRYSWTINSHRLQKEFGFSPKHSSADAVRLANESSDSLESADRFDDFGMDRSYIDAYGRTLLRFLERSYWRIECRGMAHVPEQGRGVLVGIHRGFMPFDAVMTHYLIVKETGRSPRFLIHPSLLKSPFLFNFMTKLGGILACQENADYVLERDELLGIYPEGIQGAFTLYRRAYQLGRFGRKDFVRMALRNRAPIIPFVTVGSAEIFPILYKLEWKWWESYTLWPFFPITPTFPILPIPLPSKWHIQFLPPIHVEQKYGPEAADNPAIVKEISLAVRMEMEKATAEMLSRRKSIFWGSVFPEPDDAEKPGGPV
jgi:1-acyl-sn-glycerol-3-phosphate acyltransferase/nucleoside-diphosphate-sugar epimerase